MYGRFRVLSGDISLMYGSPKGEKPEKCTPEVGFSHDGLPYISEIGVLKLCGVSVSAESDVHRLVFGVWMSVSGESDSWAAVFGFCLSVSVESDIQSTLSGWRFRRSW